ncbi:hypothetical protein PCK2_000601 [Pneumocystis canis]|nr:hypothetical protein PCK2_000601 [Pneumocystis canis]
MKTLSFNLNVQNCRMVSEGLFDKTLEIILPCHQEDMTHISVDVGIGGSLTKVVYITKDAHDGSRIHFKYFETVDIDQCIAFLLSLCEKYNECHKKKVAICIMATGGGAVKYYDRLQTELNVKIVCQDEMECLVTGFDFLITKIPNEMFICSEPESITFYQPESNIYPCLKLCNIGSGVSMIKISCPEQFQRIGGSSVGGGTWWGLMSILTNAKTFDVSEILEISKSGDNAAVDMLVGDIYGTDYNKIGLQSSVVASSFAKVFQKKTMQQYNTLCDFQSHFRPEDIGKSFLCAISGNIAHLAYLYAQIHGLEMICFSGTYIKGDPLIMNILSRVLYFFSGGTKKAYFLRHEGYLGAMGAFLKYQPYIEDDK